MGSYYLQIPDVLRDLCSGVFDEEEDDLPQLVSFRDNRATMSTGKKDSSVRYITVTFFHNPFFIDLRTE